LAGAYGGEAERVDFDTERRNVLLFELAGQVALDKGGLQRGGSVFVRENLGAAALVPGIQGLIDARADQGQNNVVRSYLSSSTVADEDELERGDVRGRRGFGHGE
jgi:hypothetical protein